MLLKHLPQKPVASCKPVAALGSYPEEITSANHHKQLASLEMQVCRERFHSHAGKTTQSRG